MTKVRKITPRMGKEIGVKRALTPFAHGMEDFFESFLPRRWMGMDPLMGKRPWAEFDALLDRTDMRFDMLDRDRDLAVRVELPGVEKEDINITIAGEYLTVEAERRFKEEEEAENIFRSELGTGKLFRTILLPVEVEPEKVVATLKDGILEIMLPKAKPEKRHIVKVA